MNLKKRKSRPSLIDGKYHWPLVSNKRPKYGDNYFTVFFFVFCERASGWKLGRKSVHTLRWARRIYSLQTMAMIWSFARNISSQITNTHFAATRVRPTKRFKIQDLQKSAIRDSYLVQKPRTDNFWSPWIAKCSAGCGEAGAAELLLDRCYLLQNFCSLQFFLLGLSFEYVSGLLLQ